MIFGFPLSILAFKRKIKNSHLAPVNHYNGACAQTCVRAILRFWGQTYPKLTLHIFFTCKMLGEH